MLRARLRVTAGMDPLVPLDEASVARIDADLAARHEDALQALDKAMCEPRYHRLLDTLLEAASGPQLDRAASEAAEAVLPQLVSLPWRRFAFGGNGIPGRGPARPARPGRVLARRAHQRQAGPVRGGGGRQRPRW